MDDDKTYEKQSHPSYGIIRISRVNNGSSSPLFGSSQRQHFTSVRLTICRATLVGDNRDDILPRHMGGQQLIEVEMTAAQFSEMILMGERYEGVPCTLRRYQGQLVEPPPEQDTPRERATKLFERRLAALAETATSLIDTTKETLDKSNLSVKSRGKILDGLESIRREITANLPYYGELFSEATETMEAVAKAEVDALVQMLRSSQTGRAILGGATAAEPPLLPEGPAEQPR